MKNLFGLIPNNYNMHKERLDAMVRGWFVGNFSPSLYKTNDVEVAIQTYSAGDYEDWHHHKIATEITVIVTGEAEMAGQRYVAGDMVVIEPGEETDFKAITDVIATVVKIPGANNDKYLRGCL
jgi:quercetin dioxygenase-like cupin family protein